jgi:hypothetical protein
VNEISTRYPARPRSNWSQYGDRAPIHGYYDILACLDPAQQASGVVA